MFQYICKIILSTCDYLVKWYLILFIVTDGDYFLVDLRKAPDNYVCNHSVRTYLNLNLLQSVMMGAKLCKVL